MALDFAALTLDFGNPVAEARACREACALFDFSFLECARISGPSARAVLEAFAGRSLEHLGPKEIAYAVRVDADGRAVGDLTIWHVDTDTYEVMSGRHQDIADLMENVDTGSVATQPAARSVCAVQGPGALDALRALGAGDDIARLRYFAFHSAQLADIPCTVGRLGYTGEAGFEIITERVHRTALWRALSQHARPAGFIAADMLRIEAGFVLFTNDFLVPVSPAEAGLGKFHAGMGTTEGPRLKLISFRADANALIRPWRPAVALERPEMPGVVAITSACNSIAAAGILGLGYLRADAPADTPLRDPTGVFRNVRSVTLPFYDPGKQRPRASWADTQRLP